MKKYLATTIVTLLTLFGTIGCDNTIEVPEVKSVSTDAITEISLSPQSPVLVADGKSELTFLVRCYYQVGKTRARMLHSRLPLDKITITSSDGKTLKPGDTYTTTSSEETVSFTAKIGNISSETVSVKLYPSEPPTYTPIVVPVRIYAFYEKQNLTAVQGFTKEALKPHFDRLNKVFSGQLAPRGPVTGNPGITFDLKEVRQIELKGSEVFSTFENEVKKNYMKASDKEISIWVMDGRLGWGKGPFDCVPSVTTGNPEDLPGLSVKKVDSDYAYVAAETEPKDVGIFMTFYQLLACMNNAGDYRFENLFGNYYGLLSTGESDDDDEADKKDGDFDYCPDTYSYKRGYVIIQKRTFPYKIDIEKDDKGKETKRKEYYYFYNSVNIMDDPSSATTITRDQAARIRQVIRDCPLRRQGIE